MKKTRRQVVNLGVGSLVSTGVLGAGLADALAQTETPTPTAETAASAPTATTSLLRPDIDLIAAQETALEGRAGASVRALVLEQENGMLLYEVELSDGAEVMIDATTGDIMEEAAHSSEDDEDQEAESGEESNSGGEDADAEEDENGEENTESGEDDIGEEDEQRAQNGEDEEGEDDDERGSGRRRRGKRGHDENGDDAD